MRTLILAVAVALVACGGSEDPAPPPLTGFAAAIQGTWVSQCYSGADASSRTILTISGHHITSAYASWAAPACTGASTSGVDASTTFTIGQHSMVPFGLSLALAYEVDLADRGTGLLGAYDLLYLDAAANPDRLYYGLTGGTHLGDTPASRPVEINSFLYLTRQ